MEGPSVFVFVSPEDEQADTPLQGEGLVCLEPEVGCNNELQ